MSDPQTLYVGWSGFRVTAISYSQASEMSECGKKFELKRIEGWAETTESASFKFGIAIENSIVPFMQAGVDPVRKFEAEWSLWKDAKLEYSQRDGDWDELLGKGRNLVELFATEHKRRFPWLNGSNCLFAKKIRFSEVSGGRLWNDVDVEYIADIVDKYTPMLLDIKTSGARYPDLGAGEINVIPWDNQLRIGSWLSGIKKVGFITLVKTKKPDIQFLTGTVTENMVADVQGWLATQLRRIQNREFGRDVGFKFPNQHCDWCEVRDVCMGSAERALAGGTLTRKQSQRRDVSAELAALDSVEV